MPESYLKRWAIRLSKGFAVLAGASFVLLVTSHFYFRLPSIESVNRSDPQGRHMANSSLIDRIGGMLTTEEHPDTFAPLVDGRDALAARIAVIREARQSIDAQYYIWHDDTTGRILLEELRLAAERGVRVRLLLDDNGQASQDRPLAELDDLPTAQVRLYNPFPIRRFKPLAYAFDFSRLNHRMHNKALIVDGVLTVIGGRNIGDVYFAYGDGSHFFDVDLLIAGQAAGDAQDNFDIFWNSRHSYPITSILGENPGQTGVIERNAQAARKKLVDTRYLESLEGDFADVLGFLFVKGENAEIALVSDTPGKSLDGDKLLMLDSISERISGTRDRADIISPYFVPGPTGAELLQDLSKDGRTIRIITNSLSSTDVPMVHGGYTRYREGLLKSGVSLFEMRKSPIGESRIDWKHYFQSSASLHGKAFAIDGQTVFVGSFNLDPRSARLNTEMGVYVESPSTAQLLGGFFNQSDLLWLVRLDSEGELTWTPSDCTENCMIETTEPEASFWQKANAWIARALRLGSLL